MRNEAIKKVLLNYHEVDEINLTTTKGHYIDVGSIVYVDVDNEDIRGTQRVTAKRINFGKDITCSLSLNKKPIKVSDYI